MPKVGLSKWTLACTEGVWLDIDGNHGLNSANDRIRNAIGTVDGVGGFQHYHIISVGKVICIRNL